MKQRLLVMNGQRILQHENDGGAWVNQKVEKAGALKPGIYNLHSAQPADKSTAHEGAILHADRSSVYQQTGKNIVMHERANFDKVPDIGSVKNVSYDAAGKAAVGAESVTRSRGRSR